MRKRRKVKLTKWLVVVSNDELQIVATIYATSRKRATEAGRCKLMGGYVTDVFDESQLVEA